MAHPVTAILAQKDELAARATRRLGDINEAHLLVGKVVSRAVLDMAREEAEEAIGAAMNRELDALLAQRRSN